MKAEKDPKTGKWLIQYRYKDWTGKLRKSTKRGFATKREAEDWLRGFLAQQQRRLDMKFSDFVRIYLEDMGHRLREHTMINKRYLIEDKLLPYFGERQMDQISVADIRTWQNTLIRKGFSQTYLKTINNQLSAIFNYAVRYYELPFNPCRKRYRGSIRSGSKISPYDRQIRVLQDDRYALEGKKRRQIKGFRVTNWAGWHKRPACPF